LTELILGIIHRLLISFTGIGFNWARKQRIVIGMTNGFVYTPEGEAVKLEEMIAMSDGVTNYAERLMK